MKQVRNNLRVLMAKKKQEEGARSASFRVVSEATGVSTNTLSKWASGKVKHYSGETIVALCEFFDCGISDLLYLTHEQSKAS